MTNEDAFRQLLAKVGEGFERLDAMTDDLAETHARIPGQDVEAAVSNLLATTGYLMRAQRELTRFVTAFLHYAAAIEGLPEVDVPRLRLVEDDAEPREGAD